MIVLYTDFSTTDPYIGQMHAVLAREAPNERIVDLLHTVPDFDIRAGAYLLSRLVEEFPPATIFVCVVDPGVGGERRPLIVKADERWYVGPDNGLFQIVVRRAKRSEVRVIEWRPQWLSSSFHGRDLFAPVAAQLARGLVPAGTVDTLTVPESVWPDDLPAIIYIDHYGNAMTGLRAEQIDENAVLAVAGRQLHHGAVFSSVTPGIPFWYANSIGLIEIAVNKGRAAEMLGLALGDEVAVLD